MTESPDNWIDAELRRVPLPPGLSERLRAASQLTDDDVDELLCAVAVPAGLLEQLTEIVSDEELDLRLAAVPVPEGLLEELAAIPQSEALRDVSVPADLLVALRRIAPLPRRWSPVRLALAASLLLLVSAAYVSSMIGWMMVAYNSTQDITATVLLLPERPVELTSSVDIPVALAFVEDAPPAALAVGLPPSGESLGISVDTRTIAEQLDSVLPAGYDLTDAILPLRYGILGQDAAADVRTPDLDLIAMAEPRGVSAPVSVGFDRQFLVKYRTQPIVALSAAPQLKSQRLPLWRNTDSFDELRRLAAAGRLPAAHQIHVEDFLAAMECQFAPAPPGELAIRTAAGPAVFSEKEASLLQVGVQAGPLARSGPVHVTLVVDTSDSMRWSDRLERARRALRRFAMQMSPDDRLTLVVYGDAAEAVLEDVSVNDLAAIDQALDALSAHGGSNFGAGLREAAMATASPVAVALGRRRIVLLTDGLPALAAAAQRQVAALLGELTADGVAIDVVDVDSADLPDERLAALAELCGQRLIVAESAEHLQRELIERTTGLSPVIARNASVTVEFNPQAVLAYRLLGHEAVSLGGEPAAIESTLLAGEAATVLLEVWLTPDGPTAVARVNVKWTDARGKPQSRQQEVRRVQFVPSLREAALSLQAATVAAEAAEALRESPFTASRSRSLQAVLEVARNVNPRLAQRPAFGRFVAVLEQAERAE